MGNSSSTASSSTTDREKYDVFISVIGEDARDGFPDILYGVLREKRIKTFIDYQLERGAEISPGLLSVIRESKISVVIFSENYAYSTRCLRLLEEILKYREMNNQIVIPVFYQVDPSHVRRQIGSYGAAFAIHENELQEEEVKKWRQALTEASNITGFDFFKARSEFEFVRNIVRDVLNRLSDTLTSRDFEYLVGMDKHIEQVVSLLCLGMPYVRIIGIWGVGGIGKTTIADAVYQLVSHRFEKTYFAQCVREESEQYSGLIRLRSEVLSEVLNEENPKTGSPSIPQWIKEMLNRTQVLIVLDDVDKLARLEVLAKGLDQFGPGSRIILTSRNKQVLRNFGVEDHDMYEVMGLNDDEARQLLREYAFKQNPHTREHLALTTEVVKIATDVPLAVKVLGSSLDIKNPRVWEKAMEFAKFRNGNSDVFAVLRICYDGLDEEEKDLFLDIACFVEFEVEIDGVYSKPNLSSGHEFSLSSLIDKSLVTVEHGRIKMHDLLREMGMEIASKNRSRLWRQEDVLRALKHNDGTDAVQGIFLNMAKLKDVCLSFQALKEMYNLRILLIKYDPPFPNDYGQVHLHISDLDYLPDKLRYLYWEGYPLEELPSSFNPENLIELHLSHSKITQLWQERTCVPKLKQLNLSFCQNLIKIPDLSDIPSVESINLKHCNRPRS